MVVISLCAKVSLSGICMQKQGAQYLRRESTALRKSRNWNLSIA